MPSEGGWGQLATASPVKRTWALLRDLKGSQVENTVNLLCRTPQDRRRPAAFTRGQTDLYSGSAETFSQSWFPASGTGFLLWKSQTKFKRGRRTTCQVQGRKPQTPDQVTPGSSSFLFSADCLYLNIHWR